MGLEIVALSDEAGIPMASSQANLTPIQRFVYIMAKDYHTPDEVKDAAEPQGMKKGNEVINGWK